MAKKPEQTGKPDLYRVVVTTHVVARSPEDAIQVLKKHPELQDHLEFCSEANYALSYHAIELGAVYLAKLWASNLLTTQIVTPPEVLVRSYLQGLNFTFDDEQWGLAYSWIFPEAEKMFKREQDLRQTDGGF